ncbi:MAG: multi-sensor signal transduction histidine kinase [Bryobacterales bacterium]|nr:multi-sensor signal transduction histidine kinase [Bryobacterales bacterium]
MTTKTRRVRMYYERRIFLLTMLAGLPGSAIALIMLWTLLSDSKTQWTLTVLIVGCWLGFAGAVREKVVFPLRTFSNLLAALQEGDFSVRARGAEIEDALGEVMRQVNSMGETLREQRLGALEATTLLRKVMEEIDVAIFAFDSQQLLRLVNRAGEKLLAKPAERLIGHSAEELALADCLEGEPARILQTTFPSGPGRWGMRRSTFREHGLPMQLVVIGDLTRPLREEELQAWQRLVRVLGHELNNSLTPIKSIAGSLENLVASDALPPDWQDDMRRGLAVISTRSESLSRFIGAYARLARLPRPTLAPLNVSHWVHRVVGLETRLQVNVQPGPDLVIHGDADQLEQLLINLLRNATDAALETGGGVQVEWRKNASYIEIKVEDEGPGLSNTGNLFVPFFTTKPGGSGIGLVLSRQIAEAHGGALTLENRRTGSGCEAKLRLPI